MRINIPLEVAVPISTPVRPRDGISTVPAITEFPETVYCASVIPKPQSGIVWRAGLDSENPA